MGQILGFGQGEGEQIHLSLLSLSQYDPAVDSGDSGRQNPSLQRPRGGCEGHWCRQCPVPGRDLHGVTTRLPSAPLCPQQAPCQEVQAGPAASGRPGLAPLHGGGDGNG